VLFEHEYASKKMVFPIVIKCMDEDISFEIISLKIFLYLLIIKQSLKRVLIIHA